MTSTSDSTSQDTLHQRPASMEHEYDHNTNPLEGEKSTEQPDPNAAEAGYSHKPLAADAGTGTAVTAAAATATPATPQIPGAPFPDGGLAAWSVVAGAWFAIFATFGYANTFGVFQSYYEFVGYPHVSPSAISWVGSIQLFFQFSLGALAGPLYDKGYARQLVGVGSILYIVSLFMTSLAYKFWQTVLAQALGIGIGVGLIFVPAVSVVSQYFLRRRALAIGIAVSGSSVGGVVLPIMLNKLIISHGFRTAVQYTGYVLLFTLVMANLLIRNRYIPASLRPPGAVPPSAKEMFSSVPYSVAVLGAAFVGWGIYFPIYYLQVYARTQHLDPNLVSYTLAILNAASSFGRITPNFLADYFGALNLITFMCTGSGILCFAVFGANSTGGLIAVAIFFGFFSGAYISLISPAITAVSKHPSELGTRLGLGFLVASITALTGTPITGALLARFGFYAPIIWSSVMVLVGSALFAVSVVLQRRVNGSWKA